jgi:L-ribulose-5-phosphate 3-epimerase
VLEDQMSIVRLGAINDELSPVFERALELAVTLGIQEIEIHTVGRKVIEELETTDVRRIQQELAHRQLHVCNISSTVFLRCHLDDRDEEITWRTPFRSINGRYADHISALERVLEIAQILQAPLVRIFGFWQDRPLTEAIYEQAARRLVRPLQMAEAAGLPLVLENCPHTYFDWGQRAARLVEMIDSPWLRLLWDPCTGVRSGEPDIMAAYPQISRRLAHVHAKDMRFDPANKRGHVYVPIGQGQLDWRTILGRLEADGYQGVVCIETHHLGPDGTKESAAIATYKGLKEIIS